MSKELPISEMFEDPREHFSTLDAPMTMRTFFDLASVTMVIIDDKQKVAMINPAGCKLLGYTENEIVNKNWFSLCLPKAEQSKVKKVFNQIMKGNIEPFVEYENYIVSKKGEKHLICWHNTYMKDLNGRIRFTLSSGLDITKAREMEGLCKKTNKKCKSDFERLKKANARLKNEMAKLKKK